jgi:hypothetical protein
MHNNPHIPVFPSVKKKKAYTNVAVLGTLKLAPAHLGLNPEVNVA